MKINPKKGLLLIKKHKKSQLAVDIVTEESDEDKRLITGEVLSEWYDVDGIKAVKGKYPLGTTVIFGKYALFPGTLEGEEFYFLDEDDVIGTCDYKE